MYAITTTPGFVIDSRPYGDAGKIVSIFTRDLGLIMVTAQGIRLEKSKLRYFTQDFSWGVYSLVRGKEFWKLTSAAELSLQANLPQDYNALLARLAFLIRRLLQGEESHAELFDCLLACAEFLSRTSSTP